MKPRVADSFLDLPLAAGGRALIEASAGTGKTWTISVLYLRLLLEQSLSARQIVVATYTNAAADELRGRLRSRLRWAAALAVGGASERDREVADWLGRRWDEEPRLRAQDVERIERAAAALDQAPIGTLHGLCQRILGERPLLAGTALTPAQLVEGRAAIDTVADDLWRWLQQTDFAVGPAEDVDLQWLLDGFERAGFAGLVRQLLQPGVSIAPAPARAPALPDDSADLLARLANDDAVLAKNSRLRRGWSALARWLRAQHWPLPERMLDDLAGVEREKAVLTRALDVPEVQDALQFSRECLDTLRRHDACLPRWPPATLEWLRQQAVRMLHAQFERTRQISFDALISRVHSLLHTPASAAALADALFADWPVALVDEFQDTDPLQYGILDRIYRDADGAPRGRLVLIGDPKQAIYRFRGGDIHTYLRAAESACDRLRLDVNQRSSSALVAAVNAFYAECGTAMSLQPGRAQVHYLPVSAAGRCDDRPYTIDAQPLATPLQLHPLTPAAEGGVDAWRELALHTCAEQIAALLGDRRQRIGERALTPADIAVLLPKNTQVDRLRVLLRERGVPCVGISRASVFASDAARVLQIVLHAVLHCDDLGVLRAALATRLFGLDYAALHALGEAPERWQGWLQRFRAWRQTWESLGVQAVVAALVEHVAADCLACVDGERLLTDLRHLGELLQEASEERAGPQDLLVWLGEQRGGNAEGDAADAAQLRIESDAQRVQLMTVHASKGLEFAIVFLPLMWDQAPRKPERLCLLADRNGRQLASSPEALAADVCEQQDEGFRLLYVALTRAVYACHLFTLDPARSVRGAGSPTDGSGRSPLDVMLARRSCTAAAVDGEDHQGGLLPDPPRLTRGRGNESRSLAAPSPESRGPGFRARPMPKPQAAPLPGRYSFSALVAGMHASDPNAESAARDEAGAARALDELAESVGDDAPPHPALMALSGVLGAEFGNAVHGVFELRQPGQPLAAQAALLHTQLLSHGVRLSSGDLDQTTSVLAERLQAVLDTPLDDGSGLRLATLPAAAMRAEMAFSFVLDGVSLSGLRAAMAALGEPELIPVYHERLVGLMSGKIDLVFAHEGRFHLLDYKSNWLGDRLDAYRGASLQAAMDAAGYRFQALLYTLALERYLRQRLPDYDRARHLGDSWYLFIRAVGLAPGAGIWRHRFSDALLDRAQQAFSSHESSQVRE